MEQLKYNQLLQSVEEENYYLCAKSMGVENSIAKKILDNSYAIFKQNKVTAIKNAKEELHIKVTSGYL